MIQIIRSGFSNSIVAICCGSVLGCGQDASQKPSSVRSDKKSSRTRVESQVATDSRRSPQSLERLETLLDGIDRVDRSEKLRRWNAIFNLAEREPEAAHKLRALASRTNPRSSRYQRFVASANVAGFGKLTGIGPNSLRAETPLTVFVQIHQSIRIPQNTARRLRLHPDLSDLKVEIPPNEKNNLKFQEILWAIIEKYKLDFRTEPDGTFVIIPGRPEI